MSRDTDSGTDSDSEPDSERVVPSGGSSVIPTPIDSRFLAKFAISLLVVSLLIGAVSYQTYTATSAQLTQDTRTEYVGLAEQSTTQIENWRTARADTTRMLSQYEVIRSGDRAAIQSFLESEMERLPGDVFKLHLVNMDTARIVASSDPARANSTLGTREAPWQDQTLPYGKDGVFVSDAAEIQVRSMVSFVSPVETDSGARTVLVMQTDFDTVATGLPQPDERVYSQVVDAQGQIVAGTLGGSAMERNDGFLAQYAEGDGDTPILERGLRGESGFLDSSQVDWTLDGSGEYVVAFAPVAGDDWVVATHVPVSYAYALRSTVTQNLSVLLLAIFVGFGFIGVTFGRGTVQALDRLTDKAQQLESGNLGVDLTADRVDEFGQLTAAFANMRNALNGRIEEAEKARKRAEVSRSEAIAMNEYLQEKAEEYGRTMQQCANGDLTRRLEADGENDAMDQIVHEFNRMIEELEKTTGQLKTFADEVADSSDVVLTSTEAIRDASTQVADSVQHISDDAYEQEERLKRLSTDLDGVIDELETLQETNPEVDIADSLEAFQAVAVTLQEAADTSEQMMANSEEIAGAAEEQAAELNEVSQRTDKLKRYAQPLGGVLDRFETDAEHEFVFSGGPSANVPEED